MHQRRGGQAEAGAEGQARQSRAERAEPPTHSIADGTALRCGRVGSRHFRKPLGFVLGASLFVGVIIPFPAAVGISFRAMPCIKCPSSSSLAPFHSAKILGRKNLLYLSSFLSFHSGSVPIYAEFSMFVERNAIPLFLSPLCRVGACGVGRLPRRCPISAIGRCYRVSSPVFV